MRNRDCNICQGAGVVRLPIYATMMAVAGGPTVMEPTIETSRTYACPECGGGTPWDRARLIDIGVDGDAWYYDDERLREIMRGNLARVIAEQLMREKAITFEVQPPDQIKSMRFGMRATLGVISPGDASTLVARRTEGQREVANEVASESIKQIDNWGSHYGHSEILKRDARNLITEASRRVIDRRIDWKKA